MSTTKYQPFETVTWYGVNGHQYENAADADGRLWTWNAEHLTETCQGCAEGFEEPDW